MGDTNAPPEPVLQAMLEAVRQGVFTGGQLSVKRGAAGYDLAVGHTSRPEYPVCRPLTITTRFDIASLTKVLCTSVLLMQAVDHWGEELLARPMKEYIPGFVASDVINIHDIGSHRAGLVAHRPFFSTLWTEGVVDKSRAARRMRELICAEPLVAEPRTTTIYSDLGYILLGWVIENLFAQPLDALFLNRIATPLGLTLTTYGPVEGPVAATERDERGELLVGRVHDENCRALGGVAGHAGLFSTAPEVAAIVRHLAQVHSGAPGLVSRRVVQLFWKPMAGSRFTLGWDTPTEPSTSGRFTTRGASVGHLGFTGCSIWHDIPRDVTIVLLTNRVHPSRENWAIRAFRPRIHDLVNENLSD